MPVIYFSPDLTRIEYFLFLLRLVAITIVLGIPLIISNLTQFILAIPLLPFPQFARKFHRRFATIWWRYAVIVLKSFYHYRVVYSGAPLNPKESAFMICNHQEMPDVLALLFVGRYFNILSSLIFFAKESLRHVPIAGWAMQLVGTIYVKSNWTEDKKTVTDAFAKANKGPFPIWPVCFVEGSRITQRRIDRGHIYAEAHNLPKLHWVLIPRTKGFLATLDALSEHIKTVYDVTIGYPDGIPSLWQYLQGHCLETHIHVKRYSIEELPKDPEERRKWLIDLYVQKDQLIYNFVVNNKFVDPSHSITI